MLTVGEAVLRLVVNRGGQHRLKAVELLPAGFSVLAPALGNTTSFIPCVATTKSFLFQEEQTMILCSMFI